MNLKLLLFLFTSSVQVLPLSAQSTDFTNPSAVLTFNVGDSNNTVRNISIPIMDDDAFEVSEQLLIVLSTGLDSKVQIKGQVQATVTITDNDGK